MSNEPVHLQVNRRSHPVAAERIAAWRDAFSLTCEPIFTPDEAEAFEGSMSFHPLGAVMLVDARYTAHSVVRDRARIARTGREHLILDVIPQGGFQGSAGNRAVMVGPGCAFAMDLRSTLRVRLEPGRFIGVVMPRHLFEAQTGTTASIHGLALDAARPEAVLLNALLVSLADRAADLSEPVTAALGTSLIGVIASCLAADLATARPQHAAPAPEATMARLRRHIERHAAQRDLDPGTLAATFGLSRTALYRLFQPEGGVAEAIRRRRAALALHALSDRTRRPTPLGDVARASGFPDARSLRRALQSVYGASPAALRHSASMQAGAAEEHGVRIGGLLDGLMG